jgi:hypothetical protein
MIVSIIVLSRLNKEIKEDLVYQESYSTKISLFVLLFFSVINCINIFLGLGLQPNPSVAYCDGGNVFSPPPSPVQLPEEPLTPHEEPPVESSSSSESLATFRNVIAAENEEEIYIRIRHLESLDYYCLPPQNNPGDYERLVREHFDAAININHFREILDIEYFELKVLERKAILQDKLRNLMLSESNIARIMDLSPYDNIQKEAFSFIQYKIEPVGDPRHAFQRHILDGCLNSFINGVNQQGRESMIYKEFYSHFTNEHFRRNHGLPLP